MTHHCSSTEHIQYVILPWTCYKTHTDLNMDDVALCHIIIIIITLSRWSRNTLSTQSIPSCTTHSVKLNTGTRPNTGHWCQHHARVKHTSAELHYIQWTQLQDETSDVTWKWCTRGPTMSVTVMLPAETAFNFQLKLLVAPQSCLTTAAACTNVRTDHTKDKIRT